MKSILLISLMNASLLYGAEFATVKKIKGELWINKSQAKVGAKVENGQVVATAKGSYATLMTSTGSKIIVGPRAVIKVDIKKKQAPLYVGNGALRWISSQKDKNTLVVKTKNAVLGVRGTDFFVSRNKAFDETEMVCFDGTVELGSQKNPKDTALIKKGQWGGIGGRFSQRIGEVIDLPEHVVEWFSSKIPTDV